MLRLERARAGLLARCLAAATSGSSSLLGPAAVCRGAPLQASSSSSSAERSLPSALCSLPRHQPFSSSSATYTSPACAASAWAAESYQAAHTVQQAKASLLGHPGHLIDFGRGGRPFASGPSRAALSRRRKLASARRNERRRPAAAQPVANRVAEATESLPALQWANQDHKEVAPAVGHRALIVGRDVEWANIIIGFEQANKYTVRDERGEVVAYIAEETPSMANAIGRQFLATHRNFVATVFDLHGSVVFRVRRPVYLINSQMFIEDANGDTIGEVVQRWHLWKRNYDLYLNKRQFAQITGSFLAWEFELKDADGGPLALIDRNFQGFGKELFTDAGKYVIHFGMPPEVAADQATVSRQALVEEQTPKDKLDQLPPVTQLAQLRTGVAVIPTQSGGQLAVARDLSLGERAIALACAISIDFDYFSHHSGRPGFLGFGPPLLPIPVPSGGGYEGEGQAAPDAGTAPGAADATPEPPPDAGPDVDLGGDEFELPEEDGGGSLLQNIFDVFNDSD